MTLLFLLIGEVSAASLIKEKLAIPLCVDSQKTAQALAAANQKQDTQTRRYGVQTVATLSAPTTPGLLYNEAVQWVNKQQVIELIRFRRTTTLDAYGTLSLYYKDGKLRRVEESTGGINGYYGKNWDIGAGKVVKAEGYSTDAATRKYVTERLSLDSMPQIYLEKPTAEWRKKVACRPFIQ